jgi:protein SCO1/2
MRVLHWILVGWVACAAGGCGGPEVPPLQRGETAYPATGILREFPVDGRSVVIRHDEIPGYMPKMTMTFTVRDPRELRALTVGDSVAFRLVATENDHWIDSLRRLDAGPGAVETASTPSTGATAIPPLRNGDPLPPFPFTDEAARPGDISQFRGSAVALTFIFTRCPLPDFCPRMSKHFARTRDSLLGRRGAPTNWQFLSLSFDPEFDAPKILAQYAPQYRGTNADRWIFAAVARPALESLAPALTLQVIPEQGSFLHNLRTVVLDTRGLIHRQFEGNEWTPGELADAMIEASRVPPP